MSFDPIPQARVVRKAGQLMTPPRAPRDQPMKTSLLSSFGNGMRNMGVIALGMWPLTAVLLVVLGLLVMAGNGNPYSR
jgi:hypothetical protein